MQARRMQQSLTQMTAEGAAAEDRAITGAIHYLVAPFVTAGCAAVYLWWRGDAMTLGHYLAMGVAGAAIGVALWRRRQHVTR